MMATTRLPSHASAPSPAWSTTPHTSMPRVNGGGVGTETRLPRQRSMSLKFSEAAPTSTRTSFGPGSGRSTVRTSRTSPGGPWRVTCSAFMSATRGSPSGLSLRRPCGERAGGGSGIRTHGGLHLAAFQELCIRPLCHPSRRVMLGDCPGRPTHPPTRRAPPRCPARRGTRGAGRGSRTPRCAG